MRAAALTIQRDEKFSLPLWLCYYEQHFEPHDLYVLDHESSDPAVVALLKDFGRRGGNIIQVFHPVVYASAEDLAVDSAGSFIRDTAQSWAHKLLRDYEYVVYTDCDELVVPREGTLREFIDHATEAAYRCTGREVVEASQHWHPDFDKTLVARIPLRWVRGFHYAQPSYSPTEDLWLYHLHRLDFERAWWKDQRWHGQNWTDEQRAEKREGFKSWFYAIHSSGMSDAHLDQTPQPLDERISRVLSDLNALPTVSPETLSTWQVPERRGCA